MNLPDWLRAEIDRRAEEDRQARKAAYDKWAADYAASMMIGQRDA
jgi:hypothetical protein